MAFRQCTNTDRCSNETDKNGSVMNTVYLETVGLDSSQEGGQANLTLQV